MCTKDIALRQEAVCTLLSNRRLRKLILVHLKECLDLERCRQRFILGRGSPLDVLGIGKTLMSIERLAGEMRSHHLCTELDRLTSALEDRSDLNDFAKHILSAVDDSSPKCTIRRGYSSKLDSLREILEFSTLRERLEEEYRLSTGIKKLRIRQHKKLGIFVEVPMIEQQRMQSGTPHQVLY